MTGDAPGSAGPPHLTEAEILRILAAVEEFDPIVVGGQAVNLWVQYYRAKRPGFLESQGAFTSKDLDFYRSAQAAEALAEALGGQVLVPGPDEATASAALVVGVLNGRTIQIDFMASVLGVAGRRVLDNQVMIDARAPLSNRPVRVMLLHPLDCLRSRLANINILHRDDAQSVRQAAASIRIVENFLDDLLHDPLRRKHVQAALLDLSYAIRDLHAGKPSHLRHTLLPESILDAFQEDARLDQRWRSYVLRPCRRRVRRWLELRGRPAN